MDNQLIKLYKNIIRVISFFILAVFVWLSLVSTSTVTLMEEVYFTGIGGGWCLGIFVACLAVTFVPFVNGCISSLDGRLKDNDNLFKLSYACLIILLFLLPVLWVLSTGFNSWADSAHVQEAAFGLINGDYSEFMPGGYIEKWPNQIGLVLAEAVICRLFGENSGLVFQLINAMCIPIISVSLAVFTDSRFHQLCVLVLSVFCFPLLFSTSHIYGNIPGLALSLLAFALLFELVEKKCIVKGLFSALLIAMACLVKQNYIIFLIAYCIIGIVMALKNKKASIAIMAIVAVALSFLISASAAGVVRNITGCKLDGGVSKLSYIAMAMQDGDRAPGWFNEYNNMTYVQAGYDTELQGKVSREEITLKLRNFIDHPVYAATFYMKKLASQWNEPMFQSIWILRGHERELSGFIEYISSIYGSYKILPYFKFFQVAIYMAAFIFICTEKKPEEKQLLLLMTFIGGVLFHIMWEAKAQYALFYFVLLIPVGVKGCSVFRKCMLALAGRIGKKDKEDTKKSQGVFGTLVCVLFIAVFLAALYYLRIPDALRSDTLLYYQYIVDNNI